MSMTRAEHKAKAEKMLENVKDQAEQLSKLILTNPLREDVNTAMASIVMVVSVAQLHVDIVAISDWDEL